MRTTLTLDDDVATKLKSKARRSGRPFREVVNDTLRLGLASAPPTGARTPFVVRARSLGRLRAGLQIDNLGDLLEQIEGPVHR